MVCGLITQDNGRCKDGPKQTATTHFVDPGDAKAIADDHRT
jgi:hypothetical protein